MFTKLRSRSASVLFCMSLTLLLSIGCSGEPPKPSGTVSGTVTLNGKPFTDAAVVFFSLQSGQADSANIQDDGSYQIPNPLWVGSYQVYLAPRLAEDLEAAEAKPVFMNKTVPQKYYNETTTDIVFSLEEGENTFAVELKK